MLKAGQEIILYGSGKRCVKILPLLIDAQLSVRAIIDSSREKWGTWIEHIEIHAPFVLRECRNVTLCITVADRSEQQKIREVLQYEYGYDMANEIQYRDLMLETVLLRQKIKIEQTDFAKGRQPHIVFDCATGLGLGGIEEWTKELCIALSGKGFDNLHIFTDTGKYAVQNALRPIVDGVLDKESCQSKEDKLGCMIGYLADLLPVTVITAKPGLFMEAADRLKQLAPDQVRMISVIHNGEEAVYRIYDRYTEHVDFFVVVSEDIKGDFIARGIPKEKIASITCPVMCEEKLERAYTTDVCQPVKCGYAGRIVITQKRMDLMLKLIETLEEKEISYLLEIAGDGAYREEMEQKVRDAKWDNHVRFAGVLERKHMPAFWRRQDICVNIADAEGRSISQLEAMANGAVPVVTCTSGTREDICDGWNGYLVEIGDYHKLADRIGYLAGHRELLPQFGQKAHDVVYPKCQEEIHTRFWETLLRSGYGYH